MQITIDMTVQDFNQLWNSHMVFGDSWAGQVKQGRFEEIGLCALHSNISTKWGQAYWVSDPAAIILARAYIAGREEESVVVYDTAIDEFVILTNYDEARET
jgi:hypothetical protein